MILPSGTLTFLFTDVEGSTKLWDTFPELMPESVARHDTLLKQAVEQNNGFLFKTTGDGIAAAFALANDALTAALAAQQALVAEPWPDEIRILARMALHTGAAELRDADYFGPTLNRCSRLLSTGHGGQTLLSLATQELVRDTLAEHVSLIPMGEHRLKDLARPETIYQAQHPSLPAEFPPLRTLDFTANNLPQQVTSFIGREQAMADVTALLGKTRLLTLFGAGGAGKTRLSLQAAADVLGHYPDGVWQVELAPLTDPSLVPQTVASVLSIKEQAGQAVAQTLTNSIADKKLLLILDNCEHLVSACASLTASLIRACPNVTVLATSREALGIGGEQIYRVPSLSLPDLKANQAPTPGSLNQFEAVRLFIDRAQAVKADFAVTNVNAPAVANICHQLDGIPLALELAAARVRSLTAEQINDRLDSRFRLLTGGDRSAMPRQQTLRALIDWSYDLLDETERALLARLSTFSGGWTLEAAEAIAGFDPIEDWEVLDILTSLTDKSLILAEEAPFEQSTRYRMLESIRQYAAECLSKNGDEAAEVSERHIALYTAFSEDAESKLTGPEQVLWLNRLETEHDNMRAALSRCATKTPSVQSELLGLRLSGSLWRFWEMRGYLTEGRVHLARALEQREAAEQASGQGTVDTSAFRRAVAGALVAAGRGAWRQGDHSEARILLNESLSLYSEIRDKKGMAGALSTLGNVAKDESDYPTTCSFYEDSLALSREIGDTQGVSITLFNLGSVAYDQGDYPTARSLFTESLALERVAGDKSGIIAALINLGNLAASEGNLAEARSRREESLALCREIGDKLSMAITLANLGHLAFGESDYAVASARYGEGLVLARESGDKRVVSHVLASLGNVSWYQNDYPAARSWFQEALTLGREIGNKYSIAGTLMGLAGVARAENDYPLAHSFCEEALTIRRETGDKKGIANSIGVQGEIAHAAGDYAAARRQFEAGLRLCREIGAKEGIAVGLHNLASVRVNEGPDALRTATQLAAAASALHESIGTAALLTRKAEKDALAEKIQATLNDEAAWTAAWAEGANMPWEEAVTLALRE